MNDSKTVFQSASANLELLLRQYKNQYPRNLGALLRNSLPILLIIVTVFILPLVTFFLLGDFAQPGIFDRDVFRDPGAVCVLDNTVN